MDIGMTKLDVVQRVLEEDLRRAFSKKNAVQHKGRPEEAALSTTTVPNKPKACYYCEKPGHYKRDCQKKKRDECQVGDLLLLNAGREV